MKKVLIALTVLVVVLGSVLTGCTCSEPCTTNGEQTTIAVPGGGTIRVTWNAPEEIELVRWEEKGIDAVGQIYISGVMVSSQKVEIESIITYLDGKEIDHWPPFGKITMEPGEEQVFGAGKLLYPFPKNPKLLEVKVEKFKILGTSGSTTPEEPKEPTEPEEPITSKPDQTVFTEAPKNPKTPVEVVAAFFFLFNGKNSEAEKLVTENFLGVIQSEGGWETCAKDIFQGQKLIKIEFEGIETINPKMVLIDTVILYYSNGDKDEFIPANVEVIQESGKWKINNG